VAVSTLVAIDPGFAARGKGCAVAVFLDGVLACTCFARPETVSANTLSVCAAEVVWELPQVDARTRASVPAIVQLAATGGTLAGLFAGASGGRVVAVTPTQWKGNVAKPVCHSRMWARLAFAERAVLGGDATAARIEAAKRAGALARWAPGEHYYGSWSGHNTLDAVALGVWRLGR
jgi:hypothetical protein